MQQINDQNLKGERDCERGRWGTWHSTWTDIRTGWENEIDWKVNKLYLLEFIHFNKVWPDFALLLLSSAIQ